MSMTYQSETETHINVSCDECDKRLKISKSSCQAEPTGFTLTAPVKCPCGATSKSITRTESQEVFISKEIRPPANLNPTPVAKKMPFGAKVLFSIVFAAVTYPLVLFAAKLFGFDAASAAGMAKIVALFTVIVCPFKLK